MNVPMISIQGSWTLSMTLSLSIGLSQERLETLSTERVFQRITRFEDIDHSASHSGQLWPISLIVGQLEPEHHSQPFVPFTVPFAVPFGAPLRAVQWWERKCKLQIDDLKS